MLLLYFTENSLTEEECEHQLEVQTAPHPNLQDPAKTELPIGEAGEDMRPDVICTLEKQEEQQPTTLESQEADPDVHELGLEGKLEKEDQVETFFSSMSHRYEEPLALWFLKNENDTLAHTCVSSSLE